MKHVDTILLVEDIDVSRAFYSDVLGLEVLHHWESMVVFKNRLAIHQADLLLPKNETDEFIQQGKQGRNNVIINLELDKETIEDTYNRLYDSNVAIVHGIQKLPWQRIFRIYDPDNHIIEIGEKQEV